LINLLRLTLLYCVILNGFNISYAQVSNSKTINKNHKSKKSKKKRKKIKAKKNKNFADRAHAKISNSVISLADSIDTFFGDERIDDESNGSRIRFFTETTIPEGELSTTEGNFLIQLVLPKTEKKFQLIVSRDDEDNQNEDNDNTATTPDSLDDDDDKKETRAGLRFLIDEANVNFSTDIGVRAQIPPLMFARARIRKNIKLSRKWIFRPVQRVNWLQEEGFSARTSLTFDKKLTSSWLLRMINNIRWNDQDYRILLRNGPTLLHQVTDKIGMSYNAFIVSESSPNSRVEDYVLSIGYRQLLYKTWFFWQVSPFVRFPREEDFHRSPGWVVRFEAIVGNI